MAITLTTRDVNGVKESVRSNFYFRSRIALLLRIPTYFG